MHNLGILTVFACIVTYALAAARVYPYEPKPPKYACIPGCFISEKDMVMPYDKPYYPPGKCEVFNCQRSNLTYWYSCGVISVQPGCRIAQDLSKNYPECCSKAVCDGTTEAPTTETNDGSATNEVPTTNEAPGTIETPATKDGQETNEVPSGTIEVPDINEPPATIKA